MSYGRLHRQALTAALLGLVLLLGTSSGLLAHDCCGHPAEGAFAGPAETAREDTLPGVDPDGHADSDAPPCLCVCCLAVGLSTGSSVVRVTPPVPGILPGPGLALTSLLAAEIFHPPLA